MSKISERVDDSATFYTRSFLRVDYKLAEYGFRTMKPFFKGETALELGPASGYMTKNLVKEFRVLHLVEGSKLLIDQIPAYENVTKFNSLFEEFETELQYDTIIMSHVLEHIYDPLIVLKKIFKWLKRDGVFIIAVPNANSLHRLVAVEMGLLPDQYTLNQRDNELGHYRVYDLVTLKEHAETAGFTVVQSGGYFLKPISNGQIEQDWDESMIEGFFKVGKHFQNNCAEIYVICTK
jgi:SAM-dependent methyltransferase